MSASSRPLPLYKTVLFVTCIVILLGNAISLYRNLSALRAANAAIEAGADIRNRLQLLNLLAVDAENNSRAYFLTANPVFLRPVRQAAAQMQTEFARLALALRDDAAGRRGLAQLRQLAQRKMRGLEDDIALYRQGGLAGIVRAAGAGAAPDLLDEIRLQVVILARAQAERERAQGAAFYRRYQMAVAVGIGINTLAIVVLALFYRSVRRSVAGMLKVEDELHQANATLEQAVASRTERLSVLSRHLLHVAEQEKARLARELHDELGANLTAIGMDVGGVADKLAGREPELARRLARARETLLQSIDIKRRIVENLRPSLLDNLGLAAALETSCEQFAELTGIACTAEVEDVGGLDADRAIALYRIAQEAFNNIAKYARATRVALTLVREGEGVRLRVADDGVGLPPGAEHRPLSHGLSGMRERALLAGGRLTVARGDGGRGTAIEAWIPAAPV